ncbi:N-acetylmuramoyl-L-alanine amidase-like domain-containing protein [Marinomonas sp. 2405UD68-3]|uniref:N-acetylmuramoyl-L-alanine amidase-like domain-containing protein n=1 Tax=Marinomonas sp. 2405UD68-3 TaxID=3391835 RepID=UPI0039C989DB
MNAVNLIKPLLAVSFTALALSNNALAHESLHDVKKAAFFTALEANNTEAKSSLLTNRWKMENLSAALLGASYEDGSLGEGEQGKYDKDPLIRFDVFDCTTYIETVLAGAMSPSVNEFMPNLMKLRYKNGEVSFVARNHFPSKDWIPNNQDKLMDVTAQVAGDDLTIAKTVIDKPAWYSTMKADRLQCDDDSSDACQTLLSQLHAEGRAFRPESVEMPYVPLTALYLDTTNVNQALLDRIPSGSIINMVRPDWNIRKWIGTNMNVSHQSIAIRKGNQLFLRHASQTNKRVEDVGFLNYFAQYDAKSSLKGFNVQVLR